MPPTTPILIHSYSCPVGNVGDRLRAIVDLHLDGEDYVLSGQFGTNERREERFKRMPTNVALLAFADDLSL